MLVKLQCDEVILAGNTNPGWTEALTRMPWDAAFYHLARVPFEKRWSSFYMPPTLNAILVPGVDYVLCHEDIPRGYRIDPVRLSAEGRPVFYVSPPAIGLARPIAEWVPLISNAAEVHCIDSAVMHLAESLPARGKLFYHKYARPAGQYSAEVVTRRKEWTVIE